jgi:hypothetical protein
MAKLVAVVGESGSGKSTSIKYLDPKETYIINTAGKELPFKGSEKLYNVDNKNYFEPSNPLDVLAKLKVVSDKAPHIKQIVIEDSNYLMAFTLVNKALETGYTKFTMLAKDMVTLIQEAKKLRSDLIIYYFTHSESVEDGDDIISYKIKTAGKMLDNQVVMEGLFTVVLYTFVDCKSDKCTYNFVTNRMGKLPAKSPDGMFENLKIDNNLQVVTETIREYYN